MNNGTLISDLEQLVTKFGSGVGYANTAPHDGRNPIDAASDGKGDSTRRSSTVSTQSDPLPIQSSPLSGASPSAGELIDELTYRSYRHQRVTFPETSPARWAQIYGDGSVRDMEARYQEEVRYVSPEQLAEEAADMLTDEPELGRDPGETRPL